MGAGTTLIATTRPHQWNRESYLARMAQLDLRSFFLKRKVYFANSSQETNMQILPSAVWRYGKNDHCYIVA